MSRKTDTTSTKLIIYFFYGVSVVNTKIVNMIMYWISKISIFLIEKWREVRVKCKYLRNYFVILVFFFGKMF